MRTLNVSLFLILFLSGSIFSQEEQATEFTEEQIIEIQKSYALYLDSVENALNWITGETQILDGTVTLKIPEGFKFLGGDDSEFVLTELWGNPHQESDGLLFPSEEMVLGDGFTYAVEITYSEDGYVSDEDAQDIDYDDLLEQMQDDTEASNEMRQEQGYGTIELVGWASTPFYDIDSKKLHWAKELKFDGEENNTLNYNIRVLGRKGYLNLNAISEIGALDLVNDDREKILASIDFNEGHRYADFNPDLDNVAAYGIGGLIAGKALAKVGFFALIAKGWKFIAIAFVAAFGFLKKMMGNKNEDTRVS